MPRLAVRRPPHLAALLTIAGFVLAACTSSGSGPAATSGAPAGGGLTVATASSALGTFLVGPDGRTLYVLTKDSANTSTCASSCADNWPPLTVSGGQQPQAGSGISGKLATLTRADGATQVSYNGLPLYTFKGDTKAGDTKGQGVGGVWFVALASGATASGAPSSAPSAPASSPPGGYSY